MDLFYICVFTMDTFKKCVRKLVNNIFVFGFWTVGQPTPDIQGTLG